MATINTYLTFLGNCEEAFNFYKSVIGGEFTNLSRFSEMPPQAGVTVTEEEKNQIMHVSLPISKETVLMGSDSSAERASGLVKGNNFSLSVNADNMEQAERIFKGLSEGGMVIMPFDKVFWGGYYGMCTDKFGINWMVSLEDQQG